MPLKQHCLTEGACVFTNVHVLMLPPQQGEADLQKACSVNGDKVVLAPAILPQARLPLLQAVLTHDRGEDLSALLKCYQEGSMPADSTTHICC